jgi:hypothetical protein
MMKATKQCKAQEDREDRRLFGVDKTRRTGSSLPRCTQLEKHLIIIDSRLPKLEIGNMLGGTGVYRDN